MAEGKNRISTGIFGLDEITSGGIPMGNQVLIAGDAGTGKTLLSFEILYRNAKINIPCTFITLEERRDSLLENIKSAFPYFDDMNELLESKLIILEERETINAMNSSENWQVFIAGINKTLQSNKSKILVIDSITTLRALASNDRVFTRSVDYMIENFRNLGINTIVTLETAWPLGKTTAGLYGTYMFDGIIKMHEVDVSGSSQYLIKIMKMRQSDHVKASMPYEITSKGLNVFK